MRCHYGTVGCPDTSDGPHECRRPAPTMEDAAWARHLAAVNAAAMADPCENCGADAGVSCAAGCNGGGTPAGARATEARS